MSQSVFRVVKLHYFFMCFMDVRSHIYYCQYQMIYAFVSLPSLKNKNFTQTIKNQIIQNFINIFTVDCYSPRRKINFSFSNTQNHNKHQLKIINKRSLQEQNHQFIHFPHKIIEEMKQKYLYLFLHNINYPLQLIQHLCNQILLLNSAASIQRVAYRPKLNRICVFLFVIQIKWQCCASRNQDAPVLPSSSPAGSSFSRIFFPPFFPSPPILKNAQLAPFPTQHILHNLNTTSINAQSSIFSTHVDGDTLRKKSVKMIQNNDILASILIKLQLKHLNLAGPKRFLYQLCVFIFERAVPVCEFAYFERRQITWLILPWMISLEHHKHGRLVEQRTAPGVAVIPALRIQLYSAWMQRQERTTVLIFSLLLQTWQPPLQQFIVPTGVPLYPVLIILLFLTIIDPTASFKQAALSFKTMQIYRKYQLQLGRNSLMISL